MDYDLEPDIGSHSWGIAINAGAVPDNHQEGRYGEANTLKWMVVCAKEGTWEPIATYAESLLRHLLTPSLPPLRAAPFIS